MRTKIGAGSFAPVPVILREVENSFNNTVAVAMSGGVDSSAVAAMLKDEGYELVDDDDARLVDGEDDEKDDEKNS